MKFFMIEYWNENQGMYKQEYYLQYPTAFERFASLAQSLKESNPEITTLYLENE